LASRAKPRQSYTSSVGVIWIGGWGDRFKDQAGVFPASCSAVSSSPHVQVAGQQDRQPTA